MASKNTHKKQQKALKKKRKAKVRQAKARTLDFGKSYQAIASQTAQYPIQACYINTNWESTHLAQITIVRHLSNDNITLAAYLVDTMCLGVKDVMMHHDLPGFKYREFMERYYDLASSGQIECSVDFAHQLIYQAIDYAAQFGLKPHKDFNRSQKFLIPREELTEAHEFSFGQDNGKPLFIQGPYDNVRAIMKKLEKAVGAGNFDYILEFDEDDELIEDDEFYDDEE